MSDLERYIYKRKQADTAFSEQYDVGYKVFKHQGSNFDDFLKEENFYNEIHDIAEKRVADYRKKLEE